jgi:hypothetical protein
MNAAIADMTCASDSDSSMCSNGSKACRGWIGWDGRPADVARQPGISELNRKPAGAGCFLQPGVGPARSICCLKNRHEGILRLFLQAGNQIAAFHIIYAAILHTQKNDAKRYKFVAPKKNAKTHLFGQKRQEVPCFFKEVRFQKSTPLVISREFVNPFAKTGGKASILVRPVNSRLLSLFAARFLGTDAQETGKAVLTGRLFSQAGSRDVGRAKIEAAQQVVGTADFANRRQVHRSLFACYANTLVARKTVAERYKRTCAQKNEKRYLFGQKGQKVPCFCEEAPFAKGSPSTISRELKVPLRKNWGKSIDFGLPPEAGSAAGAASFRGARGPIGGGNGNAEVQRARRAHCLVLVHWCLDWRQARVAGRNGGHGRFQRTATGTICSTQLAQTSRTPGNVLRNETEWQLRKKCEKHPLRGKTIKSALFLRRGYFSENIPFDDFSRVFYPLRKNTGKSIDFGLPAGSTAGLASFRGARRPIGGGNAEVRRARSVRDRAPVLGLVAGGSERRDGYICSQPGTRETVRGEG